MMAEFDPQAFYEKRLTLLKGLLHGLGWHTALRALAYGRRFHVGKRKDGVTPEFLHQVEQALYAITVRALLLYPEETIAAVFLHDVVEDYHEDGASYADIVALAKDDIAMGERIAEAVRRLNNNVGGVPKPPLIYFGEAAADAIASFVKCCDRMHNQGTMVGVFEPARIREKIAETVEHILPMLKRARDAFPEQYEAYLNVQTVLLQQLRFLEWIVKPAA